MCKPGFYCPPGGKEQIVCPSGHYCPLGSVRPFKCLPLSVCPTGSPEQLPVVGFLCCGLLDSLLLCLWLWPWLRRRLTSKQREEELETQPVEDEDRHTHELSSVLMNESSGIAGLELKFNNIGHCIKSSGKHILSGISGIAQKGSILGIMGPSGSGKCENCRRNLLACVKLSSQ